MRVLPNYPFLGKLKLPTLAFVRSIQIVSSQVEGIAADTIAPAPTAEEIGVVTCHRLEMSFKKL